MKIIGQDNKDKWILLASKHEVAHICGFKYILDDKFKALKLSPGSTFALSDIFSRLNDLRLEEKTLSKVAGALRSLADLLAPIDEAIAKAVGREEGGEDEEETGL